MRFQVLKSLFIFSLLAVGIFSNGQQVFNIKYPIPEYIQFRNVISTDTGYIFGGNHFNPGLNIIVGFMDSVGTLKFTKSFGSSYDLFFGSQGSMKKTSDGNFILCGTSSSSTNYKGFLMKLDYKLDTLWLRTYRPSGNNSTVIYGCIEINNGFVLVGTEDSQFGTQAILIKTDFQGNYLWHKYYGGQGSDYFYKIAKTPDGGFLMGGFSNSFNPLNVSAGNAGEWYVVKTDSLGNMQWQKHFGNLEIDDGPVMGLISTNDSSFVIAGGYATEFYSMYDYYWRNRVIKIDVAGNLIWDKKFEIQGDADYLMDIIEDSDGSLTCVGKDAVYPDILYKLSKNGDLIWKRHIYMYDSPVCDQRLYHFAQANDGGYVLVGMGLGIDSLQTQEGWMVKTDGMGCDGTNCMDTTLQMHVTQSASIITQGQPVTIKIFIDQGNTPVTVSYSPEVSHYPVYLSLPEATDSLVFYPMQDTILEISATNAYGSVDIEGIQIHVLAGMGDAALEREFFITPNPASSYVDVEYALANHIADRIEIYSSQQACVKMLPIGKQSGKTRISVSDLAPGVYSVRLGNLIKKLVIVK